MATQHPERNGAHAACRDSVMNTRSAEAAVAPGPAFRTLLYRYFFFAWLFHDVSRGSLLERAAAWRHNRSQAHWLLVYMKRWLWCGSVLYLLGLVVEGVLGAPLLSVLFYLPASISVPINAVIGAAWIGLKTFPPPI
jgi:hypothetical protein